MYLPNTICSCEEGQRKNKEIKHKEKCLRHLRFLKCPLRKLKMEIEMALLTRPASGFTLINIWCLMTASLLFWVIFCLSVRKYIYMCMFGHILLETAKVLHCKWHLIRKVFTFRDGYKNMNTSFFLRFSSLMLQTIIF